MKTRTFAFAALALSLAACNKENLTNDGSDGPVAARFIADIAPATRASGTTWDNGDRIGVTDIGNDTQYGNVPFILKNGKFEAEEKVIYIEDVKTHTFRAYYPYNAAGGTLAATTDATAQQNQPAIDFLFASGATGDKNSPVVSFTDKTDKGGADNSFHHRMSRITLTFEAGDGVDFSGGKPESYTLGGLQLDGTFDTATGIAAADEGAQAGELSIELADGNLTSSVILFPQTAASLPLVVEYNGQEYKATLTVPDGALKAGKNYTWTVKVNNKGLEVSEATIKAWNDISSGEGEATILDYTISTDGRTYTVYNAKGLLAWNKAVRSDLSLNCTLAADIDMTGIDWTPVGYYDYENFQYIRYIGTFDGGNHTITGLTIDLPNQDNVGLIGYLGNGGKVQNLTLAEVEINGKKYVGGVAGQNYNGTVTGCTVSGNVTGNYYVGGVAGNNYGTVTGCTVSGNVSGSDNAVGGVAGYNGNTGTVSGCTFSGDVTGSGDYVGGVAGINYGTVTGCYATGDISGNDCVGGVAGYNDCGTLTGCYAMGNVSGNEFVGGVVGENYFTSTVTACYATGNVSSSYLVGGVAGRNLGTLTACYWSNYDGSGSGIGSGSGGDATKVDGTTVTWVDAQRGMNNAIDTWNYNHSNKQCNWHYAETDAETPPTLEPND